MHVKTLRKLSVRVIAINHFSFFSLNVQFGVMNLKQRILQYDELANIVALLNVDIIREISFPSFEGERNIPFAI